MDQKPTNLDLLNTELTKLISTTQGRRAFLRGLPLLLAACASPNKHRHREGDNTGQEVSLNPAQERQMTQKVLPQMRKEYPPLRDQRTQRYIEHLGQKIVKSSGLDGKPYRYNFTVVDTKAVNAFALPAGTVFVTAPLIAMADTEAELAGVVGHEIGHIQARHTAERMHQAQRSKGKSILYGLGGAILGGAAGFGLGKLLCSKQDRECLKRAALYGSGAGALGGLLIQKFAFMANSREDEMEADRIGFRTSIAAGYHKDYVGRFYSKLLAMEQKYKKSGGGVFQTFTDAMSTHPPSRERVGQMNQMAASQSPRAGATISSNSFKAIKQSLRAYKS